jgi:hypothetical protein
MVTIVPTGPKVGISKVIKGNRPGMMGVIGGSSADPAMADSGGTISTLNPNPPNRHLQPQSQMVIVLCDAAVTGTRMRMLLPDNRTNAIH